MRQLRFLGDANLAEIPYPARKIAVTTYQDMDGRPAFCGGNKIILTEVDVPDFRERKMLPDKGLPVYRKFEAAVAGMVQVTEITGREEVA